MSAIFVLFTFQNQLPWCHRTYSMMHKLRSCAIHQNFHHVHNMNFIYSVDETMLIGLHEQSNTNWIQLRLKFFFRLQTIFLEMLQIYAIDFYLLCLALFRNHILVRVHTASYCNWMLVVNWFQMRQMQFRYDLQCGMHSGIEAYALLVDDHGSLCILSAKRKRHSWNSISQKTPDISSRFNSPTHCFEQRERS